VDLRDSWQGSVRPLASAWATPQGRLALSLGTFVAYAVTFLAFVPHAGIDWAILVVVPVWVTAWLFGAWGGVVSGLLAFLLNMTLAIFVGIGVQDWLAGGGLLGSAATLLVGVTIGHLRDVRHRLNKELAERRQAQVALKESEEKYRQLYDDAPVGYLGIDPKGVLTTVNQTLADLLGYRPMELVGKRVWDLMASEDRAVAQATIRKDTLQSSALSDVRRVFVRKDGEHRVMLVQKKQQLDCDGRIVGLIATLQDVTERLAMERQLLQSQKLRAIGLLSDGLAHEINTPLQYLSDNLHFLDNATTRITDVIRNPVLINSAPKETDLDSENRKASAGRESADEIDYLVEEIPSTIKQSLEGVGRISEIIIAMRSFTRAGTEEMVSRNINEIVQDSVIVLRHEWKSCADLELDLDAEIPTLQCVPGEINQALLAVLLNAVQAIKDAYSDEEGEKRGHIHISTGSQDGQIEIRVKDNGVGIAEELQIHVFEPFFTTRDVGQGSGQGLTMAHSIIVDGHGGSINFETTIGSGTTFIIRLPKETMSDAHSSHHPKQ